MVIDVVGMFVCETTAKLSKIIFTYASKINQRQMESRVPDTACLPSSNHRRAEALMLVDLEDSPVSRGDLIVVDRSFSPLR